jgi:hypothetical protein
VSKINSICDAAERRTNESCSTGSRGGAKRVERTAWKCSYKERPGKLKLLLEGEKNEKQRSKNCL